MTLSSASIPYGLCKCGCGKKTVIAHINRTARNWTKGEPKPYIQGHNTAHKRPVLAQPEDHRLIATTHGKVIQVSIEDFKELSGYRWYVTAQGYAASRLPDRSNIVMHRFIMKTPKGLDVDHIDRNRLNNRRSNLRNCTRIPKQHEFHCKRKE